MAVKTFTPGTGGQIAFNAGAVDDDTQRVTHASDDPVVAKLTTIDGRVDGLEGALGTTASSAVTDPTASADVIAALKGLLTRFAAPTANTQGNVTVTTSSTAMIAAHSDRRAAALYNSGSVDVFIGVGATPTTALFAFKLAPGDYWEAPFPVTQAAINGIVASGTCVIQTSESRS